MDDGFDGLALGVKADREQFARDVGEMRAQLETTLLAGAETAGRGIESALARAARGGKLEFEDLARVAGRALGEIAAEALKVQLGGRGGGLAGLLGQLVGGGSGLPGRATGGPVAPGAAYLVGERGLELFVPTSSGRVEQGGARGQPMVRMTVNLGGRGFEADRPGAMPRSAAQLARALRRALEREDR
jgi:hypothetical protein